MKSYLFTLLTLAFTSCIYMRKPPEIISSPSGLYKLKIELNQDRRDKTKYHCVLLTLYNKDLQEITRLQTKASNNMKWAVNWYPNKDTIIVNSKDIGTLAYHLTNTIRLDTITVSEDTIQLLKICLERSMQAAKVEKEVQHTTVCL